MNLYWFHLWPSGEIFDKWLHMGPVLMCTCRRRMMRIYCVVHMDSVKTHFQVAHEPLSVSWCTVSATMGPNEQIPEWDICRWEDWRLISFTCFLNMCWKIKFHQRCLFDWHWFFSPPHPQYQYDSLFLHLGLGDDAPLSAHLHPHLDFCRHHPDPFWQYW